MTNRYGDSGVFDPIHGDGYAQDEDERAMLIMKYGVCPICHEPLTARLTTEPDGSKSYGIVCTAEKDHETADDVGPPPPGADGDYPDPEIGLEC